MPDVFRQQYVRLIPAGEGDQDGQEARQAGRVQAGHSTPALTARYSHRNLTDLAGAVKRLPDFLPPIADKAGLAYEPPTGAADKQGGKAKITEDSTPETEPPLSGDQPSISRGKQAKQGPFSAESSRVADGVRTRDFQIHSLTL